MPQSLPASFAEGSLGRRVAVTLAVLAAYRLAEWIPLPGVDVSALMEHFRPGEPSSAIDRISIFALGITPLLSALIVHELARIAVPPFARWEAALPQRREDLERWTLLLALAFAAFQGNSIAVALEGMARLVPQPGLAFRAGCVASFVAATALIAWMASLINRFGIGSGFWILLTTPVLVRLPWLAYMQNYMWGPASTVTMTAMLALILISTVVLVALSKADETLVPSGQLLWPPVLAYATAGLLYVPLLLTVPPEQIDSLLATMKAGHPVRLVLVAALTVFFFVLRQRHISGTPESSGATLPALVPALALAGIATAGDFLVSSLPLPLTIDGRALIIIVAVALSVLASAKSVREH